MQHVIHVAYKIFVHQLFVNCKALVNTRLLVARFLGSQKLYGFFNLGGGVS